MLMHMAFTKSLALATIVHFATGFVSQTNQRTFYSSTHLSSFAAPTTTGYLAIDIAENAPRNILAMDSIWSSEYGIQRHPSLQLTEEDNGREVYAMTSTDVPAGSPVLYVPNELILSSSKAMEELRTSSEMIEVEQRLFDVGVPQNDFRYYYLMLKLLKEIQLGQASAWYPWLNSLPRYYTNAVSMTEFCLTCLPPLMKKMAFEEREAQERMCSKSIMSLVPFLSDEVKEHPRDLIKWVYQIVYTRAVEVEDGGDLQIIPMADYFNHGSDYTEITASYDEAGNYYAYTSYDVPSGSALRISYADPRNPSHLLARYGFLDEQCPATYCKLLPPTVNQDMVELGYSHDRMLFYNTGEVADEVWDIFLYEYLSSANIGDQQALMTAHRSGDYNTKLALHERYYEQTSAALLEHVDNFIEDIDSLIKKAETIGVSDPNSVYIRNEHPRLPLIHRHNQFVRETFQNVRNRYAPDQNWREATKVLVQECDEINMECALAECVQDNFGNWECEGGLDPLPDGSERQKTQRIISESPLL